MRALVKSLKFISVVLCLIITFGSFSAIATEREITASGSYSKAHWILYEDGELNIYGKGLLSQVPWEPYKSSILSVNISEGITGVWSASFEGCENLETVILPNGLKEISGRAFYGCTSLKEIKIPETVTLIDARAFYGCTALENVIIPNAVETIGELCFYGCANLEELTISGTVAEIGESAFNLCTNLTTVDFSNGIETIGKQAFCGCQKLTEIELPNSVTDIGNYAFYNCTNLKSIKISENICNIGDKAFEKTVFYEDAANWDNGFLYLDKVLLDVDYNKISENCRLYSKTEVIAACAFQDCKKLSSIILPDNLKHINSRAFDGCEKLESIILPEGLETIGDNAFSECKSINRFTIPDKIENIKDGTFAYCSNLECIEFGSSVKTIGSKILAYTPKITEFFIPLSIASIAADSFKSSSVTDVYYDGTKADWKRATQNNSLGDITIHYTLKNDDESVIIQHTDKNFDWESGNIHLEVAEITPASPKYDRNGYYNKNMISPIKVLDIKIVDGDGNSIQPLSDEKIIVKIKAPVEFENMILSLLDINGEFDFQTVSLYSGTFSYEQNGEKITVNLPAEKLSKLKIVHWFSDGTEPGDYEVFTYDKTEISDGYIVLKTNHFSEYAVCTDAIEFEQSEIEIENGKTAQLNIKADEGSTVTYSSSDDNVATVDSNGVVTAVGPGLATIMATVEGTGVTATCTVTVPFRTFTVKWVVDGVVTEQEVTEQSPLTAPAEVPKKEGCIFKGWSPSIPNTMPAENLMFTAIFETAPVKSIEIITAPTKTAYTYKSGNLDLSGIELKVIYEDGYSETVTDTSKLTASGFDSKKVGTQTVTVEYEGATAQFQVGVSYVWWQWIIRIILFGIFWY